MPRVGKHTRGMRFRRWTPRLSSSRRVKRLGVASCHAPKSSALYVLRENSFWIHHHLHIWKESSQSHFPNAFFFSCRRSIQAFFRKAAFRERAARPTRHARTTTSSLAQTTAGEKKRVVCVFFFDVVHRYCFLVVVQSRALTLSKIYRTKRLRSAPRTLDVGLSVKKFPTFCDVARA